MQDQLGREHIAFYSQYDPDADQYIYSPHGLIFSDEAVAQADGETWLILFEVKSAVNKNLNKVILIHAPLSELAIDEMRIWARGSGSSSGQQNARTSFMSNSIDGGSDFDCGDYASWVDGMGCVHDEEIIVTPEDDWMDDPFFNPESLDEEDDSGGFYPPQPDDTECHVAYGCGGVGGGPVPEQDPCDGDDPPDYCSEPEPCVDTNDQFLENESFQMLMKHAATESGFEESEDKRLEGFYIVKPQNGGFTRELIPYSNRTSCSFDISTTASFFEDAVALLHTHPYAPNEVVKNQDCLEKRNWDVEKRGGYPIYRPAGPSDQDFKVSKSVSLPLYTLDTENIYITSETDTTAAQAESISRCGF